MTTTGTAHVGCGADPADDLAALLPFLPPVDAPFPSPVPTCALGRWIAWGGFSLTGRPGATPLAPAAPVADRIAAAVSLLGDVSGRWGTRVDLDPAALLSARAAEAGFDRAGATSANGSCLLTTGPDGPVAVNLARPDDVQVAADLLDVAPEQVRPALRTALRDRPELVAVLQELEVPVASLGASARTPPVTTHALGDRRSITAPVVVDLSAMWAGPLCASILGRAGARVVKVEDPDRPDGARSGPPRFYADLHRGHELRPLRLRDSDDLCRLEALLGSADVVVESSRPRALRQLGVVAESWVAARPGRTWVSVTGYGRSGPDANRVAFGDDAAVAGGLVAWDDAGPVFCADAVADPLSGLYAGLAAVAAVAAGGGYLVDVAMAGVCAHVNRPGPAPVEHRLSASDRGWACAHLEAVAPC